MSLELTANKTAGQFSFFIHEPLTSLGKYTAFKRKLGIRIETVDKRVAARSYLVITKRSKVYESYALVKYRNLPSSGL